LIVSLPLIDPFFPYVERRCAISTHKNRQSAVAADLDQGDWPA
jgi:hypothetical protein